ncbi:MAG TPA: DUF2585 family protein [Pyrinomonadaceae bacterium]|nr:DUF2585 family protein [Pyrinomonadaceae bacterium]
MKQSKRRWLLPWAATLFVVAAAGVLLHWQGRLWRCACGYVLLWTSDAWSSDNSQHWFDPYAFTHVLHGVILCGLLWLFARNLSLSWRLFLGVLFESAWEVIENSEFVINRYRETTAALGYHGDTVINSLGDILACALGLLLASRLGLKRSLALFIIVEAALLLLIRDSLLLNIIMLIHPLDSIKTWQAGR